MKKISLLGASGSIGRQTLDVCSWEKEQLHNEIEICAMTANQDWRFLADAARRFHPAVVAIGDAALAGELKDALSGLPIKVLDGPEGIAEAAAYEDAEMAVAAISGMAGLDPLLAAIKAGKKIALANKEALVAAGEIVTALAKQYQVELLPVDSEHSAIWQCLRGEDSRSIASLLLTASGGPFRDIPAERLAQVTPAEALAHPNWQMGPKITVDSATMVNKGLEIIEAHWLFAMPYDKIKVLIHPESIIHSLVSFTDGSQKALLSLPDMRLPIAYAVNEQERPEAPVATLDLSSIGKLTFHQPDLSRFPALSIIRSAGEMGGTAPAYLNGANEFLVSAFLADKISFTAISTILDKLLAGYNNQEASELANVYAADSQGRHDAQRLILSGRF